MKCWNLAVACLAIAVATGTTAAAADDDGAGAGAGAGPGPALGAVEDTAVFACRPGRLGPGDFIEFTKNAPTLEVLLVRGPGDAPPRMMIEPESSPGGASWIPPTVWTASDRLRVPVERLRAQLPGDAGALGRVFDGSGEYAFIAAEALAPGKAAFACRVDYTAAVE